MVWSYDWQDILAARRFLPVFSWLASICMLFEEHGLIGVLKHLVHQMQTAASGGVNYFSYPAEPYYGLILVCSALVVVPVMSERWFGRHCAPFAVRAGFVAAIAAGLIFNFHFLFVD
jgi:hypothetical protein